MLPYVPGPGTGSCVVFLAYGCPNRSLPKLPKCKPSLFESDTNLRWSWPVKERKRKEREEKKRVHEKKSNIRCGSD